MISINQAKRFCSEDISKIENYTKAISDMTQTWDCHHKAETDENKSRKQLIDEGRYWYVTAKELIFLTKSEHGRLHNKGKHLSAETRQKLSEARCGENNPMYGKPPHNKGTRLSVETRHKLSAARKGTHLSTETRHKQSKAIKGLLYWNNGIVNKRAKECPGPGWKRGKLLNV